MLTAVAACVQRGKQRQGWDAMAPGGPAARAGSAADGSTSDAGTR
jgi:hypothetical protein